VVTPDGKVATKGTGTTGGTAVGFVIYGADGCGNGQTEGCQAGPDRLRALIWPLSAGPIPGKTLVYDNLPGADFDLDRFTGQALGGGSIQIHG
jgi:hypothetical protein